MGVEGIAVAAGVVLLVAIVAPALYRGRAVIAEAPADERFAPDLRMISERRYPQENHSEYRCTIYSSERIMDTKVRSGQSQAAHQRDSRVRMLARARSRAKARMAARQALRTRFGFGGALLAAVTITLWVLVGSIRLNLAAPIISSVILAVFVVGFVYLARIWSSGDADDAAIISEAEEELTVLRPQRSASGRRGSGSRHSAAQRESGKAERASSNVTAHGTVKKSDAHTDASSADAYSVSPADNNPEQVVQDRTQELEAKVLDSQQVAPAETHALETASAESPLNTMPIRSEQLKRKIVVPTYTIKPSEKYAASRSVHKESFSAGKRSAVTPYEPEQMPEAPVPYRPKQLGERLEDASADVSRTAQDAAEHTSVQASPADEIRQDVLGGGATLDSLLERRRA